MSPKSSDPDFPAYSPRDRSRGVGSGKVRDKHNARVIVRNRTVELLQSLAPDEYENSPDWRKRSAHYLLHLIDGQPPGMRIPDSIKQVVQEAFDAACEETGYKPPPPKSSKKKRRKR